MYNMNVNAAYVTGDFEQDLALAMRLSEEASEKGSKPKPAGASNGSVDPKANNMPAAPQDGEDDIAIALSLSTQEDRLQQQRILDEIEKARIFKEIDAYEAQNKAKENDGKEEKAEAVGSPAPHEQDAKAEEKPAEQAVEKTESAQTEEKVAKSAEKPTDAPLSVNGEGSGSSSSSPLASDATAPVSAQINPDSEATVATLPAEQSEKNEPVEEKLSN
jgi:hypothetical protein